MKRRYSGNDRHFGPFTFSTHTNENWKPLGLMLDSGGDHESSGNKGCNLKLHGFGYTLIVELPNILKDFRIKHTPTSWDKETVERLGRNFYYEVFPCEYGFTISDGTLHTSFGPQTYDSVTTKSNCYFIPWQQWRHVRHSIYDLTGNHFWTEQKGDKFEVYWDAKERVPKETFVFADYDGEMIQATTHIEEREWRFGEGWFKWLSLFRRPKIRRVLDIAFSAEVGPEKGSWKGGTTGHSIDMLPGELHESAFRRYCEQEHRSKYRNFSIAYIGKVA
jgi:hypothetical protein